MIQECAEALARVETTEKLISNFTQFHTGLVESSTKLQLTLKAMDPQTAEGLLAQSQLDLLNTELASIQEELVKQQVALPQQQVALEALQEAHPELFVQFSLLRSTSTVPPASVVGDYLSAIAKMAELQSEVDRLGTEQSAAQNAVVSYSENLARIHETAIRKFKGAEQHWTRDQSFKILGLTAVGMVLLLALAVGIVKWIERAGPLTIRMRTVLIPALWILILVIGYQTLGITGAVVAVAISTPVALWFLRPRAQKERRPEW